MHCALICILSISMDLFLFFSAGIQLVHTKFWLYKTKHMLNASFILRNSWSPNWTPLKNTTAQNWMSFIWGWTEKRLIFSVLNLSVRTLSVMITIWLCFYCFNQKYSNSRNWKGHRTDTGTSLWSPLSGIHPSNGLHIMIKVLTWF